MERTLTYTEAIHEATEQEMARDSSVIVLGLGVDETSGIYGTTRGLVEKFGADRCFDTPLAEDGMTGVAIGAALAGLRPIHVHIRMDFMLLTMNQLVNMGAKYRYMSGGESRVPLVVRSVIGKSWGQGGQHSQGLHSLFMHVPGLRVVAPSTPYDAKGILTTSIREENPVIFVEHRMLHFQKGYVPEENYTVPLGKARVLAPGTDVTLVGISYMAVECQRAQIYLERIGVSAEVIDPVSLSPLDIDTIVASARKTGRLIVADAAWTNCGATAEIVARVVEATQDDEKPVRVRRIGFQPTTCPTCKTLENEFYPDARKIASAAAAITGAAHAWMPEEDPTLRTVGFRGPF